MGALAGIGSLVGSSKGLLSLAVLVCATVLTVLGRLPIDGWKEMVLWILGIFVAGNSAHGVAAILKGGPVTPPAEPVRGKK